MDYCRLCRPTGLACHLIAANIAGFGCLLFLLYCRVRAGTNVPVLYQLLLPAPCVAFVLVVVVAFALATNCDVTQRMNVAPKSQRHFFSLTYQSDNATRRRICTHTSTYIHT